MSTEAEYIEGAISNCCGSSVFEPDVCADCLEHCSPEYEKEAPEGTISPAMKSYTRRVAEMLKEAK